MNTSSVQACIDFHFHSYYSNDAFGDPAAYVALAQARGVVAIAPTEHDNLDSLPVYKQAIENQRAALALYSGVEIDVITPRWGHCHVVAYFFDPGNAELQRLLQNEVEGGMRQFRTVVEKMNQDKQNVDVEAAFALYRQDAPNRAVGPKAVWKWIHQTGRAPDFKAAQELYGRYAKQVPVVHESMPLQDAVRAVHGAGGIMSLAHPAGRFSENDAEEFHALGIDSVEVFTPSNRDKVAEWETIARRRGWTMCGGSDNHDAVGQTWTGWPTGASASLLEGLFEAHEKRHGRRPQTLAVLRCSGIPDMLT